MRRIAIILLGVALVGASWFCSSDAPTSTSGKGGGGGTSSTALQIRLFTSNPNPVAGTCTAIQALVTLNGANVPDGTGVSFTTDLAGTVFAQNGLTLISVVTQSGVATTALCSTTVGLATVRATSTVGSETASATIQIAFQPSPQVAPFFTFCNPSFGPATGGTSLTINGGRFFGDVGTTRATFTVGAITREALVTAVSATAVTVVTPAFPEATSSSVPVTITLTFGTRSSSPVTLSLPNCFAFGTAGSATPNITAVLPSSGSNEGNTVVTIIGSGFASPVQVFFGVVEAKVMSVSFNQIVVLTPPASGAGLPNLNSTVDVRVHEVSSGLDATKAAAYRFVTALQTTAIENNRQSAPFTPVTIHGQGFLAPVSVTLAGTPATVISVSATEILVLPGTPATCGSGSVVVTNIDSGDTSPGPGGIVLTFTYICPTPTPTPVPPTNTPVNTPTPTNTPVPTADLALTKTASPNPVMSGNTLTFNIGVSNNGPSAATNVMMNDPLLPTGTTFQSCTASNPASAGVSCTGPAVGTSCNNPNPCPVSATLGTIPTGGFAQVAITVTVTAPAGSMLMNTASVSSNSTVDPNPANNRQTVTVNVN
jgi:large repetitive protein